MRPWRRAALAALLATLGLAAGESAPHPTAGIVVGVVDGAGRPLPAPDPGGFVLREAGQERPIGSVAPLAEPWRVAVVFDRALAERLTPRRSAGELAPLARRLTELGSVELLIADRGMSGALPATRDALAVTQGLSWLGMRELGRDAQRGVRRAFMDELTTGGAERDADDPAAGGIRPRLREMGAVTAAARRAVADEVALLEEERRQLMAWAAGKPRAEPGLLLLASSGFDDDPAAFYRDLLGRGGYRELAAALTVPAPRPSIGEVAGVLAAYGWVVVPLRPAAGGETLLAGDSGLEEGEPDLEAPRDPRDIGMESASGVDLLDLVRRRRGAAAGGEEDISLGDPAAPLRALAAATGGELVASGRELAPLLDELASRLRLTYAPAPGAAGRLRPVEVVWQGAPGTASACVRAPAWVSLGTPEPLAEVRVRELLAGTGEGEAGELEEGEPEIAVAAALRAGQGGTLGSGELLLQVEEDEAPAGELLRATVGVAYGDSPPAVFHRALATPAAPEGVPWSEEKDGRHGRFYSLPVPLPGGSRVVVLVEDLASGRRGTAHAALVERDAEAELDEEGLLLPAPRMIHLMAPEEVLAVGPTRFTSVVSDGRVTRVAYLLDGQPVAESRARPFTAVIDIGSLPRARVVEAVGYGAEGTELGRDRLVVNEGAGSLRVRIISPDAERLRGGRLVGPVEVEADIKVPRFTQVERVEFYWNTTLVATRFGPPYRQTVPVPAASPQGFIRVLARLADGSAGEDVVFVNSPGAAERLDVSLVELYLVVTDRDGKPVRGLPRDAFVVEEEGEEQEIASFSDAGDLPLTVGLAIDESASMFVKLPRVQRAAAEFVLGSLAPRDRAFLVGFGDEPQLHQDTTSESRALLDAIGALSPRGQTAVWKAVVYSLVQLQGVPGRKALIVFSDGADEDEEFPYRTALRFARRLGVPIYVIVTNNEIFRTSGKTLGVRSYLDRLDRLVEGVGGRVFLTRVGEDLSEIYRDIGEELRSQYLVGYYPGARGADEWRRVKVKVRRPGLEVRTVSGYFR